MEKKNMSIKKFGASLAGVCVAVLFTAACGADSSNGGDGGSDSAAASAAQDKVAPFLQPSDDIGDLKPIDGEIPEGKVVYWLEGNLPAITRVTEGITEATSILNWDLEVVSYDAADPQGPAAAMQQAVAGKADYIAVSGVTASRLGEGLASAKAAGIPVINMYDVAPPGGPENGIYASIGGARHIARVADSLANWVIADSGGEAHVLLVNVPDFDIMKVFGEKSAAAYEADCPECEVSELDISITDLTSGNVSSTVVSTLQAKPDIDYVTMSIGGAAAGLPEALEAAGLETKIVGYDPDLEQIQALIDDRSSAYITQGAPAAGFAVIDAMARLATGNEADLQDIDQQPITIWTPENVTEPARPFDGPVDFQQSFATLWGK